MSLGPRIFLHGWALDSGEIQICHVGKLRAETVGQNSGFEGTLIGWMFGAALVKGWDLDRCMEGHKPHFCYFMENQHFVERNLSPGRTKIVTLLK